MKEVDNDVAFLYWLKRAKKGERVSYYDGFLMRDREVAIQSGFFSDEMPPRIRSAIEAWKAYLDGTVRLFQRKRADLEYEYIAIKR